MSWKRFWRSVLVLAVLAASTSASASTDSRLSELNGIVVEVTSWDVAPGWVVKVAEITCPPETEELLTSEDYSDGFIFKERLTTEDIDFSPWMTGEPISLALSIPVGRSTGELRFYVYCDSTASTSPRATIHLNVLAQFPDVAAGSFYDDPVMWARLSNVTTGTSPTTFSPDDDVSRWQMALFLQRLAALAGDVSAGPDTFSDTGDLRDEFRRAIGWLADTEITTGVGNNRYDPHGSVTRWQMALFMYRLGVYLGAEPVGQLDSFSDTSHLKDDFRQAIGWLAGAEITTGVGGNRFDPDGIVSRAQMVTFLYRFVDWLRTL